MVIMKCYSTLNMTKLSSHRNEGTNLYTIKYINPKTYISHTIVIPTTGYSRKIKIKESVKKIVARGWQR